MAVNDAEIYAVLPSSASGHALPSLANTAVPRLHIFIGGNSDMRKMRIS